MAARRAITIGAVEYSSISAATKSIQAKLEKYKVGEILNEGDFAFFMELFRGHNEFEEKAAAGGLAIEVRKCFRNKCLYLIPSLVRICRFGPSRMAQRAYSFRLGREAVPGLATGGV